MWFAAELAIRTVDPRCDTFCSAIERISSAVATVQHILGWATAIRMRLARECLRGRFASTIARIGFRGL
jgi:hypothetical protein